VQPQRSFIGNQTQIPPVFWESRNFLKTKKLFITLPYITWNNRAHVSLFIFIMTAYQLFKEIPLFLTFLPLIIASNYSPTAPLTFWVISTSYCWFPLSFVSSFFPKLLISVAVPVTAKEQVLGTAASLLQETSATKIWLSVSHPNRVSLSEKPFCSVSHPN